LLEHTPVITQGRNTQPQHFLLPPAAIQQHGVPVREVTRGGSLTFHGPGQLVGYPILRLQHHERDIRLLVDRLEATLCQTLADLGLKGKTRNTTERGVWLEDKKIASIGIGLRQWTTLHGFSLNLTPNLKPFSWIVPCGLAHAKPTSLAEWLENVPSREEIEQIYLHHFAQIFHRNIARKVLYL
jgi:lipoate-protein ligase B